jgi:ParB family chromosome partitioning protein
MKTTASLPIVNVPVKAVIVPADRRERDPEAVSQLADSMSAIGLKTPITVRMVKRDGDTDGSDAIPDLFLVAGAHRLEAARSLGWSEIDAFVLDGDQVEARLWEIAENLHRKELTMLQRSQLIADWVEIANKRSGQVVQKPHGGRPEGGIAQAARTLPVPGKTEGGRRKNIERSMKIDEISPAAKQAAESVGLGDNQSALLEIAAQPTAETQAAKVAELASRKCNPRKKHRGAKADDQAFLNAVIRYPANFDRKAELLAELARVAKEFGLEPQRASPPIAHDGPDYPDLPAVPDRRRRADGERDAQAFETLEAAWAEASDAVRCRFRKEVLATEDQLPAATG